MDIQYLLFLQDFRNGCGSFLAPFLLWASDFAISFWLIAAMCMVYWVWDRQGGKRLLFGFYIGILFNGFLKLVFCVYRPWIRDPRIIPYGNSIVTATGYSFPSGHSTCATTILGGLGIWLKRKGLLLPTCVAWLGVFIVMFSRNYLGVHTPQDVTIGFLSSLLAIYLAGKIEDWTDADAKRDVLLIVAGIVLCIALALFYQYKPYPLDYLANGKLLVDPERMKPDSFQGLGCIIGYVIARYFERRGFDFEQALSFKTRLIIGLVALVPLGLFLNYCAPVLKPFVGNLGGQFIKFFMLSIYAMNIVPWVMQLVHRYKQ